MQKEINGYTLKVVQDETPMNPRTDWDNLGTMVCFHRRYDLGDSKHNYNSNDYNGWDELEKAITRKEKAVVVLPIYMYDHSGLTIATTPFSCSWDSGQIGFIFVSREAVLKEYGVKRITKEIKAEVLGVLEGEVETYDKYIRGEVYGFEVSKDGEKLDSCYGYFDSEEYVMSEAESVVKYLIEN